MGIDTSISGSSCEILVFSVCDVLVRACISILLSQAKVNNVNKISFLPKTHQEVVRLYISVNEVFRMDIF